jgi:hypothetical protein
MISLNGARSGTGDFDNAVLRRRQCRIGNEARDVAHSTTNRPTIGNERISLLAPLVRPTM